ncbi:peptidase M16 inactive domain-containing protein, partial [Gorgonomyces haynaldii]
MKKILESKLQNGLRVLSVPAFSHFVGVGIFVHTGSRFEDISQLGMTTMMDKMAFKSTQKTPADQLVLKLEKMGGNVATQANREHMQYLSLVFPQDVKPMLECLSEMILCPQYLPEEMDMAKQSLMYEIEANQHKFDVLMPEHLHSTAFKDTLGNNLHMTYERLQQMTPSNLHMFRYQWVTPERIAVVGSGIQHEQLVDYCESIFGNMPKATKEQLDWQKQHSQPAHYTGGVKIIDSTHLPPSPNPDDMYLSHVHVAFEAMGVNDPDTYSLSTLASLLGGGGSFSAGGPGKGMYTRLYTQVLNRAGWVEQCNAINHNYSDCSLFGILASIPPDVRTHYHVIPVICDQLVGLTEKITDEELNRAKNQLKSSLLMNMESKLVQMEDIARQYFAYGHHVSVEEMTQRIDELDQKDLIRTAKRVLFGEQLEPPRTYNSGPDAVWKPKNVKPTVAFYGPVFQRDAINNVGETMAKWNLNGPKKTLNWFK